MTEPQHRDGRLAICGAICAYVALVAGKFALPSSGLVEDSGLPVMLVGVPALLAVMLGPMAMQLRMASRRILTPVFWAAAGLFLVVLLSSFWSIGSEATWLQAMWILVMIGSLALVSAALQLAPELAVDAFMGVSAVAGVVFAVGGLLGDVTGSRLSAFGGGPNVFARITGIGIVSAIYWIMSGKRGWPIAVAVLPALGIATVLSGSRGGMLGTLVGAVVICLGFSWRRWIRAAIYALLTAPLVWVLVVNYGPSVENVVAKRVLKLTFEEGYTSGRDSLWASAYELISEYPLTGSGLGTFISEHGLYAHNLFIQVGVDAGMIGLLALFGGLVVVVVKVFGKGWRSPLVIGPFAAGIVIFVASMFSGDYYDSRFFWAYMILAAGARTVVGMRNDSKMPPIETPSASTAIRM